MMEKNAMHKHDQLSNASGVSGDSGFSESSNNSMGNPPSFTENNQNDSRAAKIAEVLKKHKYTIKEELRHGISGRVFLVKNPDEDYFVVKEINYRDNVNFNLDAVKNEINILKNLQHGYIVRYEDSFEESGYFYIVSEYCAGGDLDKKMKEQENKHLHFEEEQIIDWFVQICLALQYLHKNNVLHRDIKPQNVFLTEDGYINLGDVGCSKVLQSADEYATSFVGTDLYSSPEIHKKRHNSKSDIWSLGWVLHDLCMLDIWSNSIERRRLHANSLAGTIPTICNNIYSGDLKELISQMLSRDPHERPSADEILDKPFLEDAVERNRIPDALKQRFLTSIDPYNSSATMSNNNQEKRSRESDQTKQQQAHVNRSTLIHQGPPNQYRLHTERNVLDDHGKVRKWTFGEKDATKKNKIVLLVGETGAGKTTLINTMVNYLLGVKFEDEIWYEITEEEARDQSESQTSEITMYEVCPIKSPISLTIIDTSGYGDTRGLEKEQEFASNLSTLFQSNDGIRELDALCFVIPASKNRLSDRQNYIISSVLSLFGKDIGNNIVFLITHSDGLPPRNVLGAINKARIPCRRDHKNQPVHFLFNNRQADTRHNERRYLRAQRDAWEDRMEETKQFLQSLDEKNRRSLELTSDVLIERIRFEASICNLQLQIKEKESKKSEKLHIQEIMGQNKEKIEERKNFSIRFNKTVKEKVPIESASWKSRKATTCTVCEENCHEFDCWWESNPSKCKVMQNGFCTVCTGKCHHSKHVKENKKYVMKSSVVMMEFDEFIKDYEIAQEKNNRFLFIMDSLEKDLQELEEQKQILLSDAYNTIKHLCQIALKPDSAFTLQHLDFFIPKLMEAGKEDWVRELEELRKTAEAEEANKDALSYLRAGLAKLFHDGQLTNAGRTRDVSL